MITSVLLVVVALALTVIAGVTLWWQMHAWITPDSYEGTAYPQADAPRLSFSLIVPCRDESEMVMAATLAGLLDQRHPDLEVVIAVGDDDPDTVAIAHRLAARDARVHVSVNTDPVKNKPRQLNSALAMCTKEIVGIIDAESITQPLLLAHVDTMFRACDADVVQGSVQLVNYRSTWFSLRNCLEYRTWFRSRLHGHAKAGFIPLGGNTVFTRRSVLEEVGGWDGNCLAEDCEIGVRLSVRGKKIVVAYAGDLTTREEAPETVAALVKQRTRWALGFMQVLSKGEWKALPTRRQRFLAWVTLVQQHAMAFAGLTLPVALVSVLLLRPPIGVALVTYLPAVPTVLMVAFEVLILRELGRDMHLPIRLRDYVVLVASTPFYQLLLAVASVRAVWKYATGDFAWEKTSHVGSHLDLPAQRTALSLVRTEDAA